MRNRLLAADPVRERYPNGIASVPLWIPLALFLSIVAFDLLSPLGIAMGTAHILFVFSSLWFRPLAVPFAFAGAASVLIVLGYFFSHDLGINTDWAVLNRLLSIMGVWLTAIVVFLQKRTERKLEGSEERYRNIIENALDGLITFDGQGVIESFNPACERMFGRRAAETIGEHVRILLPTSDLDLNENSLGRQPPGAREGGLEFETEGQRKDGALFSAAVSLSRADLRKKHLYSAIIRDVSERKRTETERERLIDQLTRSNEELEQFAYVASHDLQEPLRTVGSFLQLLERRHRNELDEKAVHYIDRAANGAERMRVLIQDLLKFSRVKSRVKPFGPIACNALVQKIIQALKVAIDESGARIEVAPLPTVHGDATQLFQLFQNLIGNAIKFIGEAPPRIRIDAVRQGDFWRFSVQDNGIGIDSGFAERVFVIFQRLHADSEYTGTGIGLALCKRIVEQHGGQIWFESNPGAGSTFYFTLPEKRIKDTDRLVLPVPAESPERDLSP